MFDLGNTGVCANSKRIIFFNRLCSLETI